MTLRRLRQLVVLLLLGAIVNVAVAWGCAIGSPFEDGIGVKATSYFNDVESFVRQAAGLPVRSLLGVSRYTSGVETNDGFWDLDSTSLPVRVLWPGFAINTIFYAAILWVLFAAPGKYCRHCRIRCGLCPACGYLVGTSDFCTECGAPLPLPSPLTWDQREACSSETGWLVSRNL